MENEGIIVFKQILRTQSIIRDGWKHEAKLFFVTP